MSARRYYANGADAPVKTAVVKVSSRVKHVNIEY